MTVCHSIQLPSATEVYLATFGTAAFMTGNHGGLQPWAHFITMLRHSSL